MVDQLLCIILISNLILDLLNKYSLLIIYTLLIMSLTGNVYFGGQNLENTHPLEQFENDLSDLQSDITQNTVNIAENAIKIDQNTNNITTNTANILTNKNNITTNTAGILTNKNNITTNTNNINAHTTLINTLNTQCTDITYDLASDTTTISNKLTVKAAYDWSSFVNRRAQFVLTNDTTSTVNQYDTKIYAGATYGVASTSLIANVNGASCIVNTRQGMTEDSTSIILCGHHASIKRGLKIALDGGNSEYHGGAFVFNSTLLYSQQVRP
jgi:hypothetical protein